MNNVEHVGVVMAMWGLGWFVKNKTGIDQKMLGPLGNLGLAQAASFALGGSPQEGVALTAVVETGLAVGKSILRLIKKF